MRNKTQRYYYPNRHYPPKYPHTNCYYDPYAKSSKLEEPKDFESSDGEIIVVIGLIIIGSILELIFPGIITGL